MSFYCWFFNIQPFWTRNWLKVLITLWKSRNETLPNNSFKSNIFIRFPANTKYKTNIFIFITYFCILCKPSTIFINNNFCPYETGAIFLPSSKWWFTKVLFWFFKQFRYRMRARRLFWDFLGMKISHPLSFLRGCVQIGEDTIPQVQLNAIGYRVFNSSKTKKIKKINFYKICIK